MALIHQFMIIWVCCLVFLVLAALKLDAKLNAAWFVVFIPLFILDAVRLVLLVYQIFVHFNIGRDIQGISMRRKGLSFLTWCLTLAFQIILCLRLDDHAPNLKLYFVMIPLCNVLRHLYKRALSMLPTMFCGLLRNLLEMVILFTWLSVTSAVLATDVTSDHLLNILVELKYRVYCFKSYESFLRPTFGKVKGELSSNACIKKAYSTKSDYLHTSILPTYHFQECLPRLPIPKIEVTMERYLRSLRALEGHPDVNKSSIDNTETMVKEFMRHEGPELQKTMEMENEKNTNTSYITEPWFDMYLRSRLPLPLNYNPFITFKRDPNEAMNDPATRSTNFIIAAMKFQKTLNAEVLSPEVFYLKDTAKSPFYQRLTRLLPNAFNLRYLPMYLNGAFPLDMSQFANLFNSTRIPCPGKDELKVFPKSRHVLVLRNGHFYTIDGLDEDGNVSDPKVIKACINEILSDTRPPPDHSVGYLTSTDRDTWADARNHLIDSGNSEALETVDSAIFCLVLEDKKDVKDPKDMMDTFLHGDGASRWFDKSFSLIMAGDGSTALNFEHAWGDGVAVMRFFNDIFDESTLKPAINHDTAISATETTPLKRLQFKLDNRLKQSISDARERYEAATSRLRVCAGQTTNMHKQYLKEKKVSPDGVMQLAIQVGHYRLYGHPSATYESCSTSAFKHGRTETIRSCTLEAQAAAKAIVQGRTLGANNRLKDDAEYRKHCEDLVRKSCDRHGQLTKEAAMGQGFDRHMFGLRHTAEKILGFPTPRIFHDPSYVTMNHIILSTSTLASHAVELGGFAPVVHDGFGVGYGVRDDTIGCNVTSYETRDVNALVDAVVTSFDDIYTILEG